jgi:hypothetical protein
MGKMRKLVAGGLFVVALGFAGCQNSGVRSGQPSVTSNTAATGWNAQPKSWAVNPSSTGTPSSVAGAQSGSQSQTASGLQSASPTGPAASANGLTATGGSSLSGSATTTPGGSSSLQNSNQNTVRSTAPPQWPSTTPGSSSPFAANPSVLPQSNLATSGTGFNAFTPTPASPLARQPNGPTQQTPSVPVMPPPGQDQ